MVTGFEPLDLLEGVYRCVCMLEDGQIGVDNQYARAVAARGQSPPPASWSTRCFEVGDRKWRGIGTIPQSGFRLRPEYAEYDAETRFAVDAVGSARIGRRASAA